MSAAIANSNPNNFGVKRLMKEYAEMSRAFESGKESYFNAQPCEDNLFE